MNILEQISSSKNWIWPILIGLVLSVIRDITNKKIMNEGENPIELVCEINIYLGIISLIFIIFYSQFYKQKINLFTSTNNLSKISLAIMGLFGAIAVMYSVKWASNPAYPKTIYAFNVILVLVLSHWFLGSTLNWQAVVGAIIMVTGLIFVISGNKKEEKKKE